MPAAWRVFKGFLCAVGDILGMLMAWFSLFPVLILMGFVTLITFHRDLHTVSTSRQCVFVHLVARQQAPGCYGEVFIADTLLCWSHFECGAELCTQTHHQRAKTNCRYR